MIRFALILFLSCFIGITQSQNIYLIAKSNVKFTSDAPLELIEAESNSLQGALKTDDGSFAFRSPMATFEGFNSSLQKNHFNSNYLETTKFPHTLFEGKIIEEIDFNTPGTYSVRGKGRFTCHGVVQERIVKCKLIIGKEDIKINSEFTVLLDDHNIKIPSVVNQKIAEEIVVSMSIELKKEVNMLGFGLKKIGLLFSILFTVGIIWGQAPRFESYKVLKNLEGVQVNSIEQDTSGFIWLGTENGLVKYDGLEFKLLTLSDGLYSNEISSLKVNSKDGSLWIGHVDGKISILKNGKIEKFDPEEGLSTKEISSLFFDNKGIVWFTTLDEGIYYYAGENRKRLYNINTDDGLLDNYVYAMVQVHDSLFYFATDKGISVYNFNQKVFVDKITSQDGLPDNLVKKILLNESFLWIGMLDGGVCLFNIENKEISRVSEWNFGALNDIVQTADNEVWASTQKKGVVRITYDDQNNPWFSNYSKSNGLIDVRTNTIFNDREGNIWVGTKKGISIRKNNNIEFLDANSGFGLSQIFSITIDKEGQFWIATQEGLYVYHRDKMGGFSTHKILDLPEYEYAIYISVYCDINGFIWVGTYGYGVFLINPKTKDFKRFTTLEGIASNDVFHISGDSLNIWLSTAGGGVSRVSLSDTRHIKNFTINDGLATNYIYSSYIEKPNKIWLATDGGGVTIIENDTPRILKNHLLDSLNTKIYAITPDLSGNLWFNVADNGVVRIDNANNTIHLNETNGLSSNSIQSVICNGNKQLILSSNQGIDIVSEQLLQADKYGEETGLSNLKPNLNAIYKDGVGNIFIGTSKGIIKINHYKNDTLTKPKILLTSKRLFLNEIDEGVKTFNYKENNISFNYTALWYQSSGNLVYRYKLEGYDLEWSAETYTRTVTYPKLPDGDYNFRVELKLANGSWLGSNEGRFSFNIKPPFWKTTWFIIASIIFGILAVYFLIQYRIRKLKRDKELLELEVIKRTAEIHKQKEEIEAQRDEIEAQRNYVMEQRDHIEAQNKDITGSIQYASRIQRAVLPPKENFKELLGEYFIFFKPRDIVSGDFYYLNKKNNKIIVAAADCTGHGVPGAFMSLLGVALLNQIVSQLPDDYNAALLLNLLREEIKISLRQTGKKDEAKDGMDISLCVIDKKRGILDYAGAFNPLLIIRNEEVLVYKGDKMPIGVYINDKEDFTNHKLELIAGDMLYLYSDGFQDQFGGEAKRKFLPKRLRSLLLEASGHSIDLQEAIINKAFEQWKGEEHQIDDVLVMGIRI